MNCQKCGSETEGTPSCPKCDEEISESSQTSAQVDVKVSADHVSGGEVTGVRIDSVGRDVNITLPALSALRARFRDLFPTATKESKARTKYIKIIEEDVTNRLKSSIHRARFIDIGSEETLNSTFLPWLYQADDDDAPKQFTSFDEAFEHFSRRILLLGAPGAGKTTTLLHIARKLIQEAKDDPNAPIPLLFNLSKYREHDESRSAWPFFGSQSPFFSNQKRTSEHSEERSISEWLIQLTSETYRFIPKEIVQSWISEERVALLLDGLDEVDEKLLVDLVLKLNETYLPRYPDTTVVVCSRIIEYQPLQHNKQTRLHLKGAVTLQPLNQRQIDAYLEKARATALRDALPNDAALYELAQTPLTLSMMTLAYGGLAPTDIPSNLPLIERRRHLFDVYVDRMMQRKARRNKGIPFDLNSDHDQPTEYTREQINHYLGWLAVRLSERSQTVFPLHKLHSFLDQYQEEEQGRGLLPVTDIAYLVLAALCTLLIGLFLMPKSLIGITLAILISGAVGLITLFLILLKNKNEKIYNVFEYLTFFFIILTVLYFWIIIISFTTIIPWSIALIRLCVIMYVLLIAGRYLSDSNSNNRFLFLVITVISVLLPIGAMILSGQTNSPEVAIGVSMVVGRAMFLTITLYQDHGQRLWSSLFDALGLIGLITLRPPIGITLIATPDWCEVTALTGVALAVVLLNERQANIIIGATLGAVFGNLVAGPSGAVLGALLLGGIWAYYLKGRIGIISEKYVVNPILRLILAIGGSIRLNYDAFLNYTVSTLLLKEVGTEYEFVHRLLRDHFATRELTPLLSEGNIEHTLQAIQQLSLQGESALDALADLTTDSDARIRQAAVVGLGRIFHPQAVELMKKALHHPDTRVRLAVVTNANKLTQDNAKKLFEIALHDKELDVRLAVVAGIDKLIHNKSNSNIKYYFSEVRKKSIKLLTKNESRRVVPELLKPLRDGDKYMRRAAAETLGQIGDATALSGLLTALGDSDQSVRGAAAEALGQIGDATALSGLLTALGDSDQSVRGAAAKAMEQIGKATTVSEWATWSDYSIGQTVAEALGQIGDVTAVSGLLAALGDRDENVRRAAASALGRIGDATAVSGLLTALDDRDNRVRQVAAEALGQIGDVTAVSGLLRALGDRDNLVRRAAASALGRIGDATAVSGLLRALRDSDDRVRRVAASALGQIGEARAVSDLLTALRDSDYKVRWAAEKALGQIVNARAVPELLTALRDRDNLVRRVAAEALGQIGQATAVSGLLTALGDSNENVHWAAAEALGQIKDARAVSGLLTTLRDSNDSKRGAAAEALGQIVDARAVPELLIALRDSDDLVRSVAAEALGQIGDVTAVSGLLTALDDSDDGGRRAAAEALGRIGDATAVSGLLTALGDSDDGGRRAAAEALGRIGDATAISGLLTALRDSHYWVGQAAAKALSQIGDAPAVSGLLTALSDRDKNVRRVAAEALGHIGDATAVPALIERLSDSERMMLENKRVCDAAAEALERIGTPEALKAVEMWRQSQSERSGS